MKKLLLAFTIAIFLLPAAGCGQGEAASPGFSRDDLHLSIEGKTYRTDMKMEDVTAVLGSDYTYSEGKSCDYDGLDKSFTYGTAIFYTNPLAEGDTVYEIYTEDPSVSTAKGIAVGATRSDVLSAYGEAHEDAGDLLIYRVEGERAALCLELENDVVWAIYLTTQPV